MSPRPRSTGGVGVLAGLALLLVPTARPLSAQDGPVPLTRSEVVRLLTGSTYEEAERVAIVERACLTFEPTPQELDGFRQLGASDAFVDAVRACASPTAPLTVQLSASEVTARAGDSVTVALAAVRAGRPAAGVSFVLQGSGALAGDAGRDLTVVTGPEGRAGLRLPVGNALGTRTLRLASSAGPLEGRTELVLRVVSGVAEIARTIPGELMLLEGRTGVQRLEVVVQDGRGNPMSGVEVAARVPGPSGGSEVARGVSGTAGRSILELDAASLAAAGELEIWSGGRRLGRQPITWIPAAEVSADFVEGTGQTAPAGGQLPGPVLFELRDPEGRPMPHQRVDFSASGGKVFPPTALTDEAGQVSVRVWLAEDTPTTRIVAAVGRARAQALLSAEAPAVTEAADAGAEGLHREGRDALAAGQYRTAEERFGAILEDRPGDARALRGLGVALLRSDRPGEALEVLEDAVRRDPSDPAGWRGLASAWTATGRPEEARITLLRGRERVRGAARDSIDRGLAQVWGRPPALQVSAWGGGTIDAPGTGGLRGLEASFRPVTELQVWGRYDGSLDLHLPVLTRGPDVMDAYYAGAELEWGPDTRLASLVEVGRREQIEDVYQYVYRVEQGVRVPTERGSLWAHVGGSLGRWFDRDDWIAYTRWEIPVTLTVEIEPAFYVGETVGTDLARARRQPASDARAHLGLDIRSLPGWRIRPLVGYGRVDNDFDDLSGGLWEAMLRVEADVVGTSRLQMMVRHQRAPGSDPFTVVAGGFAVGVR